jgi:tetratricopeptide (TPR) repeat protein
MQALPPRQPAPRRRREAEVSQAALMHAVAISQVRRGEAALEKGDSDEALASFRAALDNEPTLAVAYRGLGMAHAMQHNDTQALQAYQKYLQLAPSASDRAEIRRSIAELKARAKIGSGE